MYSLRAGHHHRRPELKHTLAPPPELPATETDGRQVNGGGGDGGEGVCVCPPPRDAWREVVDPDQISSSAPR